MYRSTTPTAILEVSFDDETVDVTEVMRKIQICHVTFKSEDGLHKMLYTNPDIDPENHQIRITMTQSETKMFNVGRVKVQAKIKLENGTVVASDIVVDNMKEILEEEEL